MRRREERHNNKDMVTVLGPYFPSWTNQSYATTIEQQPRSRGAAGCAALARVPCPRRRRLAPVLSRRR